DTANFLTAESERLKSEIADLERKLAEFKKRNVNNLPELAQLNFQLMDRTGEELREAQFRVHSLEEQEVYLQAQLAQISPNSQVFGESGERILSSADRLKTLRTELASLSAIYAPTHPDILRVQREIAGLEQQTENDKDSAN